MRSRFLLVRFLTVVYVHEFSLPRNVTSCWAYLLRGCVRGIENTEIRPSKDTASWGIHIRVDWSNTTVKSSHTFHTRTWFFFSNLFTFTCTITIIITIIILNVFKHRSSPARCLPMGHRLLAFPCGNLRWNQQSYVSRERKKKTMTFSKAAIVLHHRTKITLHKIKQQNRLLINFETGSLDPSLRCKKVNKDMRWKCMPSININLFIFRFWFDT